jgi:phosphoribosylformylglycinamidine cyclo-ligase
MNTTNQYREEVIAPGDRASKLGHQVCVDSHGNCDAAIIVPHQPDNFRGSVGYLWKRHILEAMMKAFLDPEGSIADWVMMETAKNDGAGGKPQFFTFTNRLGDWFNLGWEIIVMCADDLARNGCLACIMLNELCIKLVTEENFAAVKALFDGYAVALKKCALVNITGETAVMKNSITSFCDTGTPDQLTVTFGGACIGLAHRELLIDGKDIVPGLAILGFGERGYRCNGGGLLTDILLQTYGPDISKALVNPDAQVFARKLTRPSISYSKTISRIIGWNADGSIRNKNDRIKLTGIAHITGGGVWGKFGEILPKGVGANLNNMPAPPPVLIEAQQLSRKTSRSFSDWTAYEALHGGCGMLVICSVHDVPKVSAEAEKDGISVYRVGETTWSEAGEVLITSQFEERGKVMSSLDRF